ncbi:hypothetical protein [Paenibacillus sp. JJ-100]|uniref:hypothetical protein n=1 Tax=Paenibacillus sp. JJ-100 TaxID=2974896 RepID=UPI00232EA40C|nr:hypothetical protein [Paenibacillus sp. JJ-100]
MPGEIMPTRLTMITDFMTTTLLGDLTIIRVVITEAVTAGAIVAEGAIVVAVAGINMICPNKKRAVPAL